MIWSLGQAVYNLLNLRTVQGTVNKAVKTFVCFTFEPYIKGVNNSKLIYYSTILRHLNPMKNKRRIPITEAANFSYVLSVFYDLSKVGPDSISFFYII